MASSRRPLVKTAGRVGLRWLYFVHRWLGVAACLFFAMWFASGVVMMYVPFPALTKAERLAHLPAMDWSKVRVTPTQALAASGAAAFPKRLRLEMMGAEPVYRIAGEGGGSTVSAASGRPITAVDAAAAAAVARAYAPQSRPALLKTVVRDQWTVAGGFDGRRPLYLFDLGGGDQLYVSSRTGEAVLDTHRAERLWNWVGSVPHWIYPTALRMHQPAWRQVIMWTSGIGIVSAFTGVWIGLLRVRLRRKAGQAISPYQGWMKWHHWAGLVGGLFLTTWIISGWLSVNPFRWFDYPSPTPAALAAYAGQVAPRFDTDPQALAKAAPQAVEARFAWFQGRPLAVLTDRAGEAVVLDAAAGTPAGLTDAALFKAAQRLNPGAPLILTQRLTQEDDYWYSHGSPRLLPVLRVGYGDEARTWVYLDPATGEFLGQDNASSRAYRWWFNGLHDLDFRFLIQNRPLWDVVVWLLAAAGMVTSVSGVVIGWRRLRRKRVARPR